MLRKILSSIMMIALLTVVVGCSSTPSQEENKADTNQTQKNEKNTEKSKVLIAFFSKTGTTEEIAKEIQTLTNGDLVEIEPVEAYPDNYQDTVDIAENELKTNARPAMKDINVEVNDYETIYIGYPIWWHDAPMIIYSFMENNDLNGKTVIPFCTSGGSDIEESMQGIKDAAKGATVLDGLTANSTSDVESWLKDIGALK